MIGSCPLGGFFCSQFDGEWWYSKSHHISSFVIFWGDLFGVNPIYVPIYVPTYPH